MLRPLRRQFFLRGEENDLAGFGGADLDRFEAGQKFIDDAFSRSEIACGDVSVTTSDRVMTLSTCTGDSSTRRILQGVLEQVYIAK